MTIATISLHCIFNEIKILNNEIKALQNSSVHNNSFISVWYYIFTGDSFIFNNNVILSDSNGIRTYNHLVRKQALNHLAKLAKCLSCVVSGLTVCYYHITFQSDFTLYSCLNVKELIAWKKRDFWSSSDRSGIRTHKQFVNEHSTI